MGSSSSKFKLINYTCHELWHTWDPSCSRSNLELLVVSYLSALKIYTSVYMASTALKGRIPRIEDVKTLVLNILRSSLFLSACGTIHSSTICFISKVVGYHNYWSLAFGSAFLSALAAINMEQPKRRRPLAIYVSYVASESLLRAFQHKLPSLPYVETLAFAAATSVIAYLQKLNAGGVSSDENRDVAFTVLQALTGKEEQMVNKQTLQPKPFLSALRDMFYDGNVDSRVCKHQMTCSDYTVSGATRSFLFGCAVQVMMNVFKQMRTNAHVRSIKSSVSDWGVIQLGLFMASFTGIFRFSSCFQRRLYGKDSPRNALVSGFLSGVSMSFYRSNSLTLYTIWKLVEILTQVVPWRPAPQELKKTWWQRVGQCLTSFELLFALGSGILLHLGITQPHNLKPSYWKFLIRLAGERITQLNRPLLDFEYEVESTRVVKYHPQFDVNRMSPQFRSTWIKMMK